MPWNDLYDTARRYFPGLMYPPISIGPKLRGVRRKLYPCVDSRRIFYDANPLCAIWLIQRHIQSCKKNRKKLILHVHNPSLLSVVLLAKILDPSIVIVTNLHNEWSKFGIFQRLSLRYLARISDKVICVSESIRLTIPPSDRCQLEERGVLDVIHNGIRSVAFDRDFPVDGLPESRVKNVVVVARMVPQKNIELVLKIFSKLKYAERLIWFGDGLERSRLEDFLTKLGIRERVDLYGVQPREVVFEALHKSSLYLSCSKWEGIGVANLEAAAMGCSPFLSNIGPHNEIADKLGLDTFPLDDTAPWIEAIDRLLECEDHSTASRRRDMARTTREVFNIDTSVQSYSSAYEQVCKEACC